MLIQRASATDSGEYTCDPTGAAAATVRASTQLPCTTATPRPARGPACSSVSRCFGCDSVVSSCGRND
ncbi:hypothetical protein FOCC_FOCC008479 [Frankliniella occidentalis]|nr:hypothetical protein FOCC_FOCC008479 [Frankliniella occidentalis]